MRFSHYRTGAFVLLLLTSIALLGWILLPLLAPILWAGVFALLLAPIQQRLAPFLRPSGAAAVLTVGVIAMCLIPLVFVAGAAVNEAVRIYQLVAPSLTNGDKGGFVAHLPPPLTALFSFVGLDTATVAQRLAEALSGAATYLFSSLMAVGQVTVGFVFQALVMLYLLFFALRDGASFVRWLVGVLPLGDRLEWELFDELARTIRAVLKGTFVVALIQGALGGVAWWLAGLPAPVLWSIVMAFVGLLPSFGPAIILAPAAIVLAIQGAWVESVVLLIAAVVVSTIDNLLRPLLVGRGVGVPDVFVFLATLGGIATFGASGFILGPLALALAHVMVRAFQDMYREALAHNT